MGKPTMLRYVKVLIFSLASSLTHIFRVQSSVRPNQRTFQGEKVQIDGDGGILEAAMSPDDKSNTYDGCDDDCERLCDRIRPRRELGDWIETEFNLIHPDTGRMKITCNCEDYSVWGDCEHCIYVEVIHRGQYKFGKKALANEQWQKRRDQIILNLNVQCGRVQAEN